MQGVPIISGKANISYHAHFGPVRMFLPVVGTVQTPAAGPPVRRSGLDHATIREEEERPSLAKQVQPSRSQNIIYSNLPKMTIHCK